MMKSLLSLLALLIICFTVNADDCIPDDLGTIELDQADFRGKWFEHRWRPPADNDPVMLETTDYTWEIIESTVPTHDTLIISFRNTADAKCSQITYSIEVGSSHFVIELPDRHINGTNGFNAGPRTTIDIWILAMEKDNYLVTVICEKDDQDVCKTSTMEYSAWSRVAGGFTVPSLTPLRAALATQCLEYDDMELSVQSDVECCVVKSQTWQGVDDFNVVQFTSDLWFEKYSRPYPAQPDNGVSLQDVTLESSGDATQLANTLKFWMDNTNNMYGSQCTQLGNALDMAEDGEGYGLVTMVTEDHLFPDSMLRNQMNWWILDTDYTSYAITASCTKYTQPGWDFCMDETIEYSIWSRTKDGFSAETLATLQEVMNEQCVISIADDMSETVHEGKCSECELPTKDADLAFVDGFDLSKIGGIWYAHYFRPSVISTLLTLINYKGFMANITDTAEPMVKNFAVSLWRDDFSLEDEEHCVGNEGTFTFTSDLSQPAVYNRNYTLNLEDRSFMENTWFVDTDYDNYAILFSCDRQEDGLCSFSTAYYRIWTRTKDPISESVRNTMDAFLSSRCEDLSGMFPVVQDNACEEEEEEEENRSGANTREVHLVAVLLSSLIFIFKLL